MASETSAARCAIRGSMTAPVALDRLGAVLMQVLQHSDLCKQQHAVCRLLCASKTYQAVIQQGCVGKLEIQCRIAGLQHVQLFGRWLQQHGKLIKSLDLHLASSQPTAGPRKDAATSVIAAALQQAAAAEPEGLFLQNVKLQDLTCTPELLEGLQQSSQLTRLQLRLCRGNGKTLPNDQPRQQHKQAADPLVQAMAGLTSLRDLTLHSTSVWGVPSGIDNLLPAVLSMRQLTALQIDAPHLTASLQQLPQQLQQLHLVPDGFLQDSSPDSLHLTHLTALTKLDSSRVTSYSDSESRVSCRTVIREADQLPPSLQTLIIRDAADPAPFRQLQQLQKLVMSNCSATAADLQLIASYCKQLQDLQLWYDSAELHAAAAAWQFLPLTELHISNCSIPVGVLQSIGGLGSKLKCLDIRRSSITASEQETAEALQQLSGLRTLQLFLSKGMLAKLFGAVYTPAWFTTRHRMDEMCLQAAEGFQGEAAQHQSTQQWRVDRWQDGLRWPGLESQQQQLETAAKPVTELTDGLVMMHAVARLPSLSRLVLSCDETRFIQVPLEKFVPLGVATQLTCLKLCGVGLTDDVVQLLIPKLPGLQHLVVKSNPITNACLPCIADNSLCLKWMDLSSTKVTSTVVQELQSACQLQSVVVRVGQRTRHVMPRGARGLVDLAH